MKSPWHGQPGKAHWYLEVIFTKDGEQDYNHGYCESVEKPDPDHVWDLVPEGYTLVEYEVISTPQHSGVTA
jgi:hypothetical protein